MAVTGHRLPRAVALVALLVYGLTLSWGTTLNSLPLAANVAGWDWQPLLNQPLTWLLTLPLRVLSAAWIPAALNLFFALCGALTFGLLARSIELMPWDCPPPENKKWIKILPVLLACGVGGLEFDFWQEATAPGGAMLNQLLLAAAIWCLLEHRVAKEPRWLNAAAVIWGLGLAQSWVMLLNLPLFVAALVWLRGRRFFKWDFLLRMFLLGLAGFSIYAAPPLVNGLNPHSALSFGGGWLATLATTKSTFALLYAEFGAQHRLMTLVLILFFMVPTLPTLVRLHDDGKANKSKVDKLQIRIYRAVRVALLLACLWLAFCPSIGPQQILLQEFGISLPLLTFDYLNALGIAFLAGNLLFVSQVLPERRSRGLAQKINSRLRNSLPVLLAVAAGIILFCLAARNAPVIFSGNRQPLENFGELAARSLPAGGGILFGDDGGKLAAVQAALAHRREGSRWLTVELLLLPSSEYRAALERRQPLGWITEQTRHELKPIEIFRLLHQLAQTNRLFSLQLSAGQMLFEQFYPQPQGAVAELKTYESEQSAAPSLSAAALDDGEKFWDAAWREKMAAVCQPNSPRPSVWSGLRETLSSRFYLPPIPVEQRLVLSQWYSISLDEWGVELQRAGRLPAARRRFEQALALNANNAMAAVNLECNTNLAAGKNLNLTGLPELAARFDDLPQLTQMLNRFGPFDQPALCFLLGRQCQLAGLPRQAVQQLQRAMTLAPGELPPAFALAEVYARYRQDDKVFAIVKNLRGRVSALPTDQVENVENELDLLEAKSWMSQTNTARAHKLLQSILDRHPQDPAAANLVLNAYMSFGDFTNALHLVANQLAREPDNLELLNNQAGILLQMQKPAAAIAILNRALAVTNAPTLRLNLALAYFQNQDLAAAAAEYHQLENEPVDLFRVQFGLANIAEQSRDTNLAIHYFELCLTNLPAGTPEREQLCAHLAELKNSARVNSATK
jgi:Tfp pilus assembly protein PilF